MSPINNLLKSPIIRHNHLFELSSIFVDNIQTILESGSNEHIAKGLQWYGEAHDYAVKLAKDYDLEIDQTAGIIASLSPGVQWDINKRDAEDIIINPYHKVSTYGKQAGKAQSILFGAYSSDILGRTRTEKKEFQFYQNILNPSIDYFCTVDVWAHRALINRPTAKRDDIVRLSNTRPKYKICADIYRTIATDLGILANQLQAIVWTILEDTHGRNYAIKPAGDGP